MKISVKLDKFKEHRSVVRYQTDDHEAVITNIYVAKDFLPTPFPAQITVTIEAK